MFWNETEVIVAQYYESTKCHRIVHFNWLISPQLKKTALILSSTDIVTFNFQLSKGHQGLPMKLVFNVKMRLP